MKCIDGPAKGILFGVPKAPRFVRVVRSDKGEWDVLDAPQDAVRSNEPDVYAYERIGEASVAIVCCRGGNNRGCHYRSMNDYRVLYPQPEAETLRDNERWKAWCKEQNDLSPATGSEGPARAEDGTDCD